MKKIFITLLISLFSTVVLFGQTYKISTSSKITIAGESTLHDWESDVTKKNGTGIFKIENNTITDISKLELIIPVKDIKSGKGQMDKLTFEALKEKANPNIKFVLKSVKNIDGNTIKVTGLLTIAGFSKDVELTGISTLTGDNINIKGSHTLDMTEYGMDTPTAMLGTIKVGKMITIKYDLLFVQ